MRFHSFFVSLLFDLLSILCAVRSAHCEKWTWNKKWDMNLPCIRCKSNSNCGCLQWLRLYVWLYVCGRATYGVGKTITIGWKKSLLFQCNDDCSSRNWAFIVAGGSERRWKHRDVKIKKYFSLQICASHPKRHSILNSCRYFCITWSHNRGWEATGTKCERLFASAEDTLHRPPFPDHNRTRRAQRHRHSRHCVVSQCCKSVDGNFFFSIIPVYFILFSLRWMEMASVSIYII